MSVVPSVDEKKSHLDKSTGIPRIIKDFVTNYGTPPDFISRSPGRVNLIGEHIDYADFSVLPMAIEVDVLCAVKITNDRAHPKIVLNNSNPKFSTRCFELPLDGSLVPIDATISDWSNYFKCGLLVAQKYLKEQFPDRFESASVKGLDVFVSGNVPTGGGLSSSAAFTCAVALAIIRANTSKNHKVSKQDLMRITVTAEHYVGVNNGGMDQAASVCGEVDHALYVEFKPELKATPFRFPKLQHSEIKFIVANTLVVSNKVETAPTNYNLRVVEVTVAANVLASHFGLSLRPDGNLRKGTLRGFMDSYYAKYHGITAPWDGNVEHGIERLNEMLRLLDKVLRPNGYTVEEASESMDCSVQEFGQLYLTRFPVKFNILKLYQRAKHVYSESLRVLEALKLMKTKVFESDEDFFTRFGNLMNESQNSCDTLYECSCPETDLICEIARASGSYGSRLTGAGWGGSTVHLVPSNKVEEVKEALIEQYYKKKFEDINADVLNEAILVSRPALGSCIIEL
ncbi:LAFE_0H16424g1_1 [Lachancea fermentati]|uniref:Galactokinase n=1 Tax=Lachancea fermentati TaxID=4955 RepID=A0A1G4ML08_LACFM|nr:LAFE_0H16424g1_1 [Lachancea fermentati]